MQRTLQFVAIGLTALSLVPGGAHLLEMTNKISLDQDQYMTVQQIYRGWAFLGIIIIAAILVNGLAALVMRRQPVPLACAAGAAILLCLGLAIFFTWTFPVEPDHQQLDDRPGRLAGPAGAVGIFACRQCPPHVPGAVFDHRINPYVVTLRGCIHLLRRYDCWQPRPIWSTPPAPSDGKLAKAVYERTIGSTLRKTGQ